MFAVPNRSQLQPTATNCNRPTTQPQLGDYVGLSGLALLLLNKARHRLGLVDTTQVGGRMDGAR